jgi:hypothetical protein
MKSKPNTVMLRDTSENASWQKRKHIDVSELQATWVFFGEDLEPDAFSPSALYRCTATYSLHSLQHESGYGSGQFYLPCRCLN